MIRAFARLLAVGALLGTLACEGRGLDESLSFEGPISDLHVRLDAGDIELIATDEPGVRVEVDVGYHGGTAPELQAFVDGSLLRVWLSCGDGCWDLGGRVKVFAPRGISGKLDTGGGDIEVEGAGGELVLECSTGAVRGTAITSARLRAVADRCPVMLAYAAAPTLLDVDVGQGDIVVEVPTGAYLVDAFSSNGSVVLDAIDSDPESRNELILSTYDGDVRVSGF
jgi:hypothetical protein